MRHHLQHNLGREDSSVVFVGYAAVGTLARRIVDGAKRLSLAKIFRLRLASTPSTAFSAHADEAELLAWQKQTGAKRTFLVHGDEDIMR